MTYLALPSIFNRNGSKEFQTLKEAKSYLDEKTGYIMTSADWCLIKKIMIVDENGQLLPIAT